MKVVLSLALLVIFFSFSFKAAKTYSDDDIKSTNKDYVTKVAVTSAELPILTVDCDTVLTKVTYKFRLVNESRFSVDSKNGLIKIQFTCPNEIFKKHFILNKIYYLKIAPFKSFYTPREGYNQTIIESNGWNIPVYQFAG